MTKPATFTVLVRVSAAWCDEDLGPVEPGDPLADRLRASVEEAVRNALGYGRENGFSHDMESLVSLEVKRVAAFGPPDPKEIGPLAVAERLRKAAAAVPDRVEKFLPGMPHLSRGARRVAFDKAQNRAKLWQLAADYIEAAEAEGGRNPVVVRMEVEGGVIHDVVAPDWVTLDVRDYDVEDRDPEALRTDAAGNKYYPVKV